MKCLPLALIAALLIVACNPVLRPNTSEVDVDIESKVDEFCNNEGVDYVYVGDDYIKVVGSLVRGGSVVYRKDMTEVDCLINDPDIMSKECKKLIYETEWEKAC